MKIKNQLYWGLRLLASIIMLQTLLYKFTAAPESVHLFTKIGMEPWGRIGIGILELVASILILIPKTTAYGALLGTGLMSGAIFFHLTLLGIVFQNDAGLLFIYALLVFISCLILVYVFRSQLLKLFKKNQTPYENA